MQRSARIVLAALVLLFAIAATVNLGPLIQSIGLSIEIAGALAAQVLAIAALAGSCALFTYVTYVRPMKSSSVRPPVQLLPLERAKTLQDQALGTRFTNEEQARLFALCILEPQEVRQRVVESYTPSRRSVRQRVSVEVRIPEQLISDAKLEKLKFVYVPLLIPVKGRMQDQFDLYDGAGEAVSVLTYREYLQLTAQVLRLLLRAAYPVGGAIELADDVRKAELSALAVIMQRRNQRGQIIDVTERTGWRELLTLSAATEETERIRDVATRLAQKLSTNYALVAIVPTQGTRRRFLLKYEQTVIPGLRLSGLRKRIGVALGARPVSLTIDLNNASTCQSFHLRVAGDDETYLGSQALLDAENTLRGRQRPHLTPPHYRFRQRLGQPYAHFYSRYFPDAAMRIAPYGVTPERERPRARFQFFEVPPGSMIRAAASALACLALILSVGWIISDRPSPGTDVPAILLAFPAVVGTWLGFDAPSRRLLEGTLTARLSLVATVALSVTATAYYMALNSIGGGVMGPMYPDGVSVLGVTNVYWSFWVVLAVLNASIVCYRYSVRVWEFSHLCQRTRQPSDIEQEG
jgi:hypothetical protein